ncbi:Rv1678 family membrane protein [Actinophytocola sp.]|uniref:Rv1678 family membrane protein n=1 Tax=Actinophytocola sp. TaxID=1872138 RepID=UPI003D6B9AB4
MSNRLDRAALVLGIGALACSVFAIAPGSQSNKADFVQVADAGLVALLVLGAVAVLGGLVGQRLVVVVAGLGFVVAAVVGLVQWGSGTNWLTADGSTVSMFGGLGIGLLAIGLTPRDAAAS